MADAEIRRTIETVHREEAAGLIARLTRIVRDVDLAEELAQDALVAALGQWPDEGLPRNPGAWLFSVARHRALDRIRRERAFTERREEIARALTAARPATDESDSDDELGDEVLRLMFMTCHESLSAELRTTLTLRLLGGLSTADIARAYLTTESAIAQRIVRAKRTLAAAGVGLVLPEGRERRARLASVLEVVYLVFNEGHVATAGGDLMRPDLTDDALRLGRTLARVVPDEPEVQGLLALMELGAARAAARVDESGRPVLIHDQDRRRWDPAAVERGLAALSRMESLGRPLGSYGIQALIAACHVLAPTAEDTPWPRIASLYDALLALEPTPVVALNRAVAVARSGRPEEALATVEALRADPALRRFSLLAAVRGDVLDGLGRADEAAREFERAADLVGNASEAALLRRRAREARERGTGEEKVEDPVDSPAPRSTDS